ncbi:hypothetical protein Lbir_1383 [Legionella birminghamensis]|uniref:Uncharacterized protein n=1 Tax=Legionella birminghamensis TaxID=28083 RepID=A0A378IC31_9GAMM|nr:hypothetical protein [Legionella birminghamensis]KTC72317.1 hypothetical protein Lbir_1383 [Legionella birminghamensis]STX32777.1 Uncharacterised protein [Legionella birminghamensis]
MNPPNLFENGLFDVEHALGMYATSYSTMPAEFLYNKEALKPLMRVIDKCHIYIIGFQPKIDFLGAKQHFTKISLTFSILGNEYTIENNVPEGMKINQDKELYLTDEQGKKYYLDSSAIQNHLSRESNAVNFEVKYIGQAFGKDGSRNVLDRLLRHETLQKISLQGLPDGY